MSTQKNHLNKTALLATPKQVFDEVIFSCLNLLLYPYLSNNFSLEDVVCFVCLLHNIQVHIKIDFNGSKHYEP